MTTATAPVPETPLTVGSSAQLTPTPVVAAPAAPVAAAKVEVPAAVPAPTSRRSLLSDEPEAPSAPSSSAVAAPRDVPPAEIVYALTAPEKSALTADDVKAVEAFARERKLSPEAAQAIVDRDAKQFDAFKAKHEAAATDGFNRLYDTWAEQSAKDPVIGGAKWKETQSLARRALNIDPAFKALISTSPFGNHPKVLAFLAKVGAMTTETTPPAASSAPPIQDKPAAARWFPSMNKKA